MATRRRIALSRVLVWCAAVAGLLHAAASLYWALGGRWLLAAVGQEAVQLAARTPLAVGAALGLVALVKLLAAMIPVGVAHGWVPWPRMWRAISWAGGSVLIVYGGISAAVSNAVLAGTIRPQGGYDRAAMAGHAYLWDPLFFLWGAALVMSLWLSRMSPPRAR